MDSMQEINHLLLMGCNFALVDQDEGLVEMTLEQHDPRLLSTEVKHFLVTRQIAAKLHERLHALLQSELRAEA